MPTITFHAKTVASLRPTDRRTEYFDAMVPGLALRVTPTGAKSWTVLYRHRGRLRRLTLGTPKELSLAAARERARDTLRDVRDGADPATAKQQARRARTIDDLAAEYLERWAKKRKRSWREDARILRADVLPAWGPRAIEDITRRDVRELVQGIADRGAGIMANRTISLLSKLFAYAVDQDIIETSPAVRIPRPAPAQSRDRVLSEDEIRAFWQACDTLAPEMAAFYRLRLLTAQRGGEVAAMRWQDVDLAGGWWTIPAAIAKNKLPHRVPLAPAASRILAGLLQTARPAAVYVLAGARGRRQRSEAAATIPIPDFRGHDLRRTAASLMASGGISRLTIAKVLNHAEKGVTAIYDRHSYDAEKQAALTWWDAKLASIIDDKPAGAVLPFQRGA